MSEEPIRILIVEARFYDDLADALLEGATQALSAYGARYDVVTVPGGPRSALDLHIGHRRHFTPDDISQVLTDAGFKVEFATGLQVRPRRTRTRASV